VGRTQGLEIRQQWRGGVTLRQLGVTCMAPALANAMV
jgi:hypothetical protein